MPTNEHRCTQCGAPLPADARFCETCGAPAGSFHSGQTETVIGHLPAERFQEGAGVFGRVKVTQLNLVITTSQLLCLQETNEMNETWLGETERLFQEEQNGGMPWRALMDAYDWSGPLWDYFYKTPAHELIAADRDNEAIPLSDVVSAEIALDDERDRMDIRLANGETYHFQLFNQVGRPAARFFAQALGPERVRLTHSQAG